MIYITCIVAIKSRNNIYLGADSTVSMGMDKNTLAAPKIFRKGKMLIGGAGTLRALQTIEHDLVVPPHRHGVSNYQYCATDFMLEFKSCLQTKAQLEDNFVVLLAYKGSIFQIRTNDFSVLSFDKDYAAIGSGQYFAEGSLHSSNGQAPESRIRKALAAASEHDAGVGPPFYCINMKVKKPYKI